MRKPPRGTPLTVRGKRKQKNGDINVYGRETLYVPIEKYNRILKSKLLHEIPAGSTEPVAAGPKSTPLKEKMVTSS